MRILIMTLTVLVLSGCASNSDKEIEHDPSSTDKPLPSPCVCQPVPYSAPAFEWIG